MAYNTHCEIREEEKRKLHKWYKENWYCVDVSVDESFPVKTSILVSKYLLPKHNWCLKNLGSIGTVWMNDMYGGTTKWYEFFFANEADAIAFKLANG